MTGQTIRIHTSTTTKTEAPRSEDMVEMSRRGFSPLITPSTTFDPVFDVPPSLSRQELILSNR